LLERVKARDPAAWKRLALLYEPLINLWCRQAQLQDADTADVRQEVFLAVANHIADFRRAGGFGVFRGWLRTITRNKIHDHRRKARPDLTGAGGSDALRALAAVPGPWPAGEEHPPPQELSLLYRRALELIATDFDERVWRAFVEVVVNGRAPRDVAAQFGLSANAVYLAKSRVLARLREEYAGLLDGGPPGQPAGS
jgi:RNA polymerase sigma-70 factor (ECF subfamily)